MKSVNHRSFFLKGLGIQLFFIILSILIGYVFQGSISKQFNEGGVITYLSLLNLLYLAYFSFRIYRCYDKTTTPFLYLLLGIAFLFLAADEMFLIHEQMDLWIHQVLSIEESGLSDRLDDAIVGVYGLFGLGVLWHYRQSVFISQPVSVYFALGFILFFFMVSFDMLSNRGDIISSVLLIKSMEVLEDSFKVLAEFSFISAFFVIFKTITLKRQSS